MNLVETSPCPSRFASEATLLVALRAGDAAAYEFFVRDQTGRMLKIARRYLRNEDDARDAVQDAFVSAYRALPGFKGAAKLSTWLHRIVVNAALMKLRTRSRRPERSIEDLLPRFLTDGHQAEPARRWRECGETALLRREVCDRVRTSIDQLPDSYRIVLLLRDVEELDTESTARQLGISAQAVKARLHRARKALRTLLDPYMREGVTQ